MYLTCWQVIAPVPEQPYAATSSHVTIISIVAEKVAKLGNTVRILFVPNCKMDESVVVRYQRYPPFAVLMSVQNGAIILCDPVIGKAFALYSFNAVSNVTSPLLLTWKQTLIFYPWRIITTLNQFYGNLFIFIMGFRWINNFAFLQYFFGIVKSNRFSFITFLKLSFPL